MDVIRTAIAAMVEKKKDQSWQFASNSPYRLDVALRCAELGDTRGLSIWLRKIDENLTTDPLGEHQALVVALNGLLKRWQDLEAIHGVGALLDYQTRLRASPADVVGLSRIECAKRFQEINGRVPDDPFWALQFG